MVDPKRLIESMKLCRGEERDCQKCVYWETENDCRDSMIHDAVDVIKVIWQTEWERDVALNQLRQIGKGLGEKMDDIVELVKEHEPVKPKAWVPKGQAMAKVCGYYCPVCDTSVVYGDRFCHWCGRGLTWDE